MVCCIDTKYHRRPTGGTAGGGDISFYIMKERIKTILILLLNVFVWLIMLIVSLPVALLFSFKRIFVNTSKIILIFRYCN